MLGVFYAARSSHVRVAPGPPQTAKIAIATKLAVMSTRAIERKIIGGLVVGKATP